ncbi:MAG: penicillin acylase family protein [Rhodothermia bacterium]|nr:penicillin acylase family protein [Rhodothermia bacterium]
MSAGDLVRFVASVAVSAALLLALAGVMSDGPAVGGLLDPVDGLYRTARTATYPSESSVELQAIGNGVEVIRDERGVPHIFADNDRDAMVALGYVVAQDRLFQLDFIPRAASGRLSAVLGPNALATDRFMRTIGMDLGAKRNASRILEENGVESDLVDWYCAGVNAYVGGLDERDLPFEMRLLGYQPDRCSALQVARVLQFMTYDLTFRTDEALYGMIGSSLSPEDYAELYPQHAAVNDPIIPMPDPERESTLSSVGPTADPYLVAAADELQKGFDLTLETLGIGFVPGRGSNNWAVAGRKSTTGAPILAGDMHLRVSLPAIWYEAHIVTPEMNLYGVTVPGAPGLVEAFNADLAWAFTNTGADQIDHVALQLDTAGTRYQTADGWKELDLVVDTIAIRGAPAVIDTFAHAPWGPVLRTRDAAVALRWVGHDTSKTLEALWRMGHARSMDQFEDAVRLWDTPMQNILFADVAGNIAIRSTGLLPIRERGDGAGLLRREPDQPVWSGRVPFEELPFESNPAQGYLASANQEPAGDWYPHYLGHDWRTAYRGLRINELLRERSTHSVDDIKRYQSDVVAVHARHLTSTIDDLRCDLREAEDLRIQLASWDGEMGTDAREPLAYDVWRRALSRLAWDEPELKPKPPYVAQLYRMLTGDVSAKWADVVATTEVESVSDLLCLSLEAAADALRSEESDDWGSAHRIIFRHLISSSRFSSLGRGPFQYPGTSETLSPAAGRLATHSASWRVVVDLSSSPPIGFGVYPGGVSGNPFSPFYDLHVQTYLNFDHYRLHNPSQPDYFASRDVSSRIRITP